MSDGDREELRLALALNGGVSLAIWMGGVTHEINRLRTGTGIWEQVLEALATDVRVDVIAGASAGGINGAFLATAMVFDSDLSPVRDLWVERGSFKDLIRGPFESPMPSLLRGDGYFLPELRKAFEGLVDGTPATASDVPVELTLTTTSLAGRPTSRPDDFGSIITDVSHAEEFTFRRGPGTPDDEDPFRLPDIVARLALAARCTASFPGAFEPSWCPVRESGGPDLPDMKRHVEFDYSRFVVDGGVLVNKPVEPALRTIFAQQSARQIRRVLMYVVPDPGKAAEPVASPRDSPPAPTRVVFDSLVALPRVESIAATLDRYRVHNQEVHKRRGARDALVVHVPRDELVALAEALFQAYRAARRISSCSYVVDEVALGLNAKVPEHFVRWHRDELLQMLYQADLPWLPRSEADLHVERGEPWRWGAFPIERAAGIVLDLVHRAYYVAPFNSSEREKLGVLRKEAHELLTDLRTHRRKVRWSWWGLLESDELHGLLKVPDPVTAVTAAVVARSRSALANHEYDDDWTDLALRACQAFRGAAEILTALGAVGLDVATAPSPIDLTEKEILGRWAEFATGDDAALMSRLLAFEVLETAFGQNDLHVNQAIEVVQVSAGTPGLLGPSRPAAAHLAGVQLGHFGAFYKRSWRANDWMWGRLDGVSRLAQVILDPRRIRQLAADRPNFRGVLEEMLLGPVGPERTWLKDRVGPNFEVELSALVGDKHAALPDAVPECALALGRRLQLEVLRDELPLVADAVVSDVAAGAHATGRGVDFANAWKQAVGTGAPEALTAGPLVHLLRKCDIGAEGLDDDYGSNLFVATVSSALAATVSVVQDKHFGLGHGRHFTSAIRAPVLMFWFLARNARTGSSLPMVNALILGVGATIVALSIFVAEGVPGALVGLGWLAVIGGLLLALARSMRVVFVAAILAAAAFAVWIAVLDHPAPLASSDAEIPRIVSGVAMVVLLALLGSIRWPRPRGRRWRRRPRS